jgi:hypothetical protein
MAGQTITVTADTGSGSLTALTPNYSLSELQLQVVNPDGTVIATDESQQHSGRALDHPITFTADRPGLYKFALTDLPGVVFEGEIAYKLKIEGVGDMGLAAMAARGADGEIYDAEFDRSIQVDHGDFGVLFSNDLVMSDSLGPTPGVQPQLPPTTYYVANGDLRNIQSASIGWETTAPTVNTSTGETVGSAFGFWPLLYVPNGSVGLVNAFGAGATDILALRTLFDPNQPVDPSTGLPALVSVGAVGGDFQIISASGSPSMECFLQIACNGGIGTIRAAQMTTSPANFIEVNADNKGNDGIIDLIDVTGAFGTLGPGGPEIVTNQGGDVRYMRLGGMTNATIPIIKDDFFGGTPITPTLADVGATVQLTDDSGVHLSFQPTGLVINTTVTNADGTTSIVPTGPQISYDYYPIRDKGGVVPLAITSTGGMVIGAVGASGFSSSAEISSVSISGQGEPVTVATKTNSSGAATPLLDSNGNTFLTQAPVAVASGTPPVAGGPGLQNLQLNINGSATVDVLDVTSTSTVAGNGAVAINNNTPGELVDVTTNFLGTLFSKGNIGTLTPHATPAAVLPNAVQFNAYPQTDQRWGVNITGAVINVTANGSIGNVNVPTADTANLNGTLQNLTANADGVVPPGHFDGIVGNIVAQRILNASIGQGIIPSGSGLASAAGLWALKKIGTVTSNSTTYIRGNIISLNADAATAVGIDAINIVGSIIDTSIGTFTAFAMAQNNAFGTVIPVVTHIAGGIQFDIGSIKVTGFGGIIGSHIHAHDIGPTVVGPQGFGILNTSFASTSNGHIGTISAGGYGIRNADVSGGSNLDALVAYGNGALLSTQAFPIDVRPNEAGQFDPFFGEITVDNDIDLALGVTKAAPSVPNVTDTGVIEDTVAQGDGILGTVQAQKIRTTLPPIQPAPALTPTANIPRVGIQFPMSLSFGAGIQSILVRGIIDGLQITAGHLGNFVHNGSISRIGISVAGPVGNFRINGNLGQTITDPGTGNPIPDSYVQASGATGVINSFLVTGDMSANVLVNADVMGMTIGKNVFGSITINGQSNNLALTALHIGGGLSNGALTVNGSVGSIIANESFGSTGGVLNISGNLGSLAVGVDHRDLNANIGLNLNVGGSLSNLVVFGRIDGSITTAGDLGRMTIVSPVLGNNAINGSVTVNGRLGSAMIVNGQVNGNVVVNGSIGSFTLQRGSVLAGKTIESQLNAISSFRIVGGLAYGMFGNLLQPVGAGGSIDISGNVGDGTDAASITAAGGNTYRVRGSIKTGATIAVTGQLNLLQVDQDIETGANVSAHPLKRLVVIGENLGNVITT